MSDPETLRFYERNAPRYTLSFGQAPSRHLDAFLDLLPTSGKVLELGCGAGRDAARIAERGFAVDATDGAAAMVRKTRERFAIAARQMQFHELEAVAKYDAVWAHACLQHVTRADLPHVLHRIARALKPCGLHFASYKLGTGEGRDLLGRLHNFPTPEWLADIYVKAGFTLLESSVFRGEGADGTMRDWAAITCRKHG